MSGAIQLSAISAVLAGTMMSGTLLAQTHKEYRFNVGPRAGISVNNPYGSVSVKPSIGNVVVVNAILSSDKVQVDNALVGNRVEIQSRLLPGRTPSRTRRLRILLLPTPASPCIPVAARARGKLHGDISLERRSRHRDVRDVNNAHVHVKTLNGPSSDQHSGRAR